MGGFGSGRKFGANVTEDYRSIDVRRWQRERLLTPGNSFDTTWSRNGEKIAAISVRVESDQLRLIYNFRNSNAAEWESLDYPVKLQTTTCNYGGERYWFICPAADCGKKVALLYSAGKYFACRHCYQLAYKSQHETKGDRGYRGAGKIREKLGWQAGIANPPEGKPKGMHWKTYNRLMNKHIDYSYDAYRDMMATFKKIDASFGRIEEQLKN